MYSSSHTRTTGTADGSVWYREILIDKVTVQEIMNEFVVQSVGAYVSSSHQMILLVVRDCDSWANTAYICVFVPAFSGYARVRAFKHL